MAFAVRRRLSGEWIPPLRPVPLSLRRTSVGMTDRARGRGGYELGLTLVRVADTLDAASPI